MTAAQYAALLGLWIAGIISPGPDVLVILRNAFLTTRGKAMLTAAGLKDAVEVIKITKKKGS